MSSARYTAIQPGMVRRADPGSCRPDRSSGGVPLHIGVAGPIATADIAHLLDDPSTRFPRGYEGAPTMATLIGELLRRGHQVSAFTLSADLPLDAGATVVASGPGLELYWCPMRPRAWPFNGRRLGRIVDLYAFERRGLERAMVEARPDLVHAHWAYEFAWAALRSGINTVVTCHDSPFAIARFQRDFRHGAYRWLRAGMAWHVLRHARSVTTVSPYMADQIQPLCRAGVRVVPNPIPYVVVKRAPRAGRRHVFMVANGWSVLKNGKAALSAFALLAARLPGVELSAFGHGYGEGEPAQAWWRQAGLSGDVHFHGFVSHERLQTEWVNADVFMHASLEEAFGAGVAEAMAAGVPVVAGANSGAVPWVVGEAGCLVDVRQPEKIADALHYVLGDVSEIDRMGRLGSQRVRSLFNPETVVTAYLREYAAAHSGGVRLGRPTAR
jgi:L-malate glycosyltransferase